MRDVISDALRRQLGDDWFELRGEVAVDAITTIQAARFVDARWGHAPHRGDAVVPLFMLDGFRPSPVIYGGRRGIDDLPRCPLVSVLVTRMPAVLDPEELDVLQRVTGPRLPSLTSVIDGMLWASSLGLCRCSRAARRGEPS